MVLGLVAVAAAAPAGAATINVRNTNDAGAGSLRKAVDKADPGDRVQVPGGHYVLTSGVVSFDKDLKIAGAGRPQDDPRRQRRQPASGDQQPGGKVTISGLTLREGDADDSDGGAITSNAKLVLKQVAVLNNSVGPPDSLGPGGGVDTSENLIIRQSLF